MIPKDRPYVSNYPPLHSFLKKHRAHCNWQLRLGGEEDEPTGFVEQHMFPNGRTVIVVVHAFRHGWDMFTAPNTMKVDETLNDVATRLGLGGES